jgi:hypothetical protein
VRHDNPHYNFLARTLADIPDVEASSAPDWRWEEVARIAADETILPPLSSRLEQLGVLARIPPDVGGFFTAFTELNAERNRQILREIEAIATLLNQAGIEPVVLKGPAYILTGIYEDPAHRFILDIDLLIPEFQIDAAFSIIRDAGYTPAVPDLVALAAHHYPALVHAERIRVELHHGLGTDRCNSLLPPNEIIERSAALRLGQSVVRVPSPPDLAAHLIVHSQIHHAGGERVWPPLRAQYDLFLLRKRFSQQIDWLRIRDRFRRHRQLGLLELHLLQVAKVLGQPPPFPLRLGALTRLRWYRRQALWRYPSLRFIDPVYFLSSATNVRPSLSRLLQMEGGLLYVLSPAFVRRVCKKLINSFRR